ncbi:hypothetical protein IAQ61_001760 [Plenodomus lingam]|uniref:Uncharacterized protein n=1 Tax=Leptosphaeria maculans (strain JN3 / isolate v23.1.3 / race Av1-4-5-6-7-8) TaxID=985895 RepID=E4ZG50_LEPMJ|nr:hypothetical protein LEMA_P063960.1 [Plenodomus lingam JN3]KAH9878488.1 hypothetical protein IAQ61_001760 [Plenodomus lingam]CBX90270.1 hypothetical protein LEMA_P063960.1 [Plenodomus lingam JN3]
MYTQHLLDRAYGFYPHYALQRAVASRLIHALHPYALNFSQHLPPPGDPRKRIAAHPPGVNALTIDKFEGRYLLSGGADSSIAMWDLESQATMGETGDTMLPLEVVHKTSEEHKLGITQIGFYPFDSLAFMTSSYDHTVKLYSSETLKPSAVFDLDAVVYNFALSPIASHLLVACATQHPNVRLIDLRSGASTHSLAGHSGAILSTAWNPVREHILVSGATDGSVRFWDIRRSIGELGTLDLEDSVGSLAKSSTISVSHMRRPQAHRGPVNGIVWTEDGRHLITCGHDARIRVWNTETGGNTLANFGPMVKNSGLAPRIPVLPSTQNLQPNADVMFYPNESEILAYELFEGKLRRRLRRPHQFSSLLSETPEAQGHRNIQDRINSLAWRAHQIELYSAHADGSISAWKPRTEEDAEADADEEQEHEEDKERKKRKRGVLDDIYQGLMKKQITFGGLGP